MHTFLESTHTFKWGCALNYTQDNMLKYLWGVKSKVVNFSAISRVACEGYSFFMLPFVTILQQNDNIRLLSGTK